MASTKSKSSSTGPVRSGRRSSHHSDAFSSPVLRAPPTRAKSGCWTCRLRRKKCDENKRTDGSCETCQRLKIECLGWGAKRPDWCRDKDKVEHYKQRIKHQVSFVNNFRASDELSKGTVPPLTPNSTSNLGGNDPFSTDAFEYEPVFMSDLADGPTSANPVDFYGQSTATSTSSSSSSHHHFNPPPPPPPSSQPPSALDLLDPSELDLGTFLSHLPNSHHHLMPQPLHPAHWSNQTTPELRSSGDHNSPELNDGNGGTGVNPITSAIDQSMSTIGLIPSSAASSTSNAGPSATSNTTTTTSNGLSTIPTVPSSTPTSSWGGLDYSPFATLPPLYSSGSAGTHYYLDPASSAAAAGAFGTTGSLFHTPSLLSYGGGGGSFANGASSGNANGLGGGLHLSPLDIPGFLHQKGIMGGKPISLVDADTVREQASYYFDRVYKTQYPFAGASSKDVLRDIAIENPYGVVTNAICALASIHDTLTRKAAGLEAEDPESSTSLPRRFYEQANEQLMSSKARNGGCYTSLDATAALQLVSFSVFVGGIRGWENALKIASDWYEKTGVTVHENPLRAMWELNLTAKFASRLTVWYDVLSSVTLHRPARFLSTYQKMLRQDDRETFWRKDLNMQATMGCPDGVLLAIAEVVELAHWRDQEKKRSSLSYRELNRRADLIEQDLRVCRESLDLQEARAVLANSAIAPSPNHQSSGSTHGNMSSRSSTSGHSGNSNNHHVAAAGAAVSAAGVGYAGNGYGGGGGSTANGIGLFNVVAHSAPGTPSSTSGESVLSVVNATPSGLGPIQLPLDPALASTSSVTVPIPSPPPSTLTILPSSSRDPSSVSPTITTTTITTTTTTGGSTSMMMVDPSITGPAIQVGPGEFVLNLPPLHGSPTPSARSNSSLLARPNGMNGSSSGNHGVGGMIKTANMFPLSIASLCEPMSPPGLSEGDIRRRAGRIFLEGALLYLHSVVSDSNPNVTEVVEGVKATMDACCALPPSDVDRALVFPLFIGGVMAESEECRMFFRSRLDGVNRGIGNCGEAVKVMEAVWEKRDALKRSSAVAASVASLNKQRVHWRDVMEEMGVKLLLA
ncbi:hypothetical protein FRC14_003617 [Serendipita sp. 396]|nr:hypothetical protein FRC14_003617 [Serendipita sp. 396]KAG8799112.1 hypothetical protein FRC16_005778 [Serendipita sp. 398]KAG8867398.1 hypothetical protein FRC20_005864 [Serendipita sp. 405]